MKQKTPQNNLIKDVGFFMDSVGDGILVVDTKGKIVLTNWAMCEILGSNKKEEILGQSTLSLLGAMDEKGKIMNARTAALFKSIHFGKKINDAHRQFLKKDKTHFWASITTTPIKTNGGKIKGAIIMIRDITEEKTNEEYRTDFAHVASHNLRTPLGNLMWALEYILSEKPGKLNDKQKEYLSDGYRTLQSMNRLVNDLLSISRIQNKRLKMKKQVVPLVQITKDTIANLTQYAKAENVRVQLSFEPKSQYNIYADSAQASYIMQNIIENSIRYALDHSVIKVKLVSNGKTVTFSCTNKGIGIPEDKKQFVFAKFFRAKNAVEKEGDGTGLGLYITHEFVKLNKGKIWFESIENKETTFFINFKKA
jgi:PAS domain S-box-containing protein